MRTVVLGDPPVEIERLIALRRANGTDMFDEVWEGEYHMAPAPRAPHARLVFTIAALIEGPAERAGLAGAGPFNLGVADNYRVPDLGLLAPDESRTYVDTAQLVVEVLSPDDETREKLPFYADHGVDEVVIVDPARRSVDWLRLVGGAYEPTDRSVVLGVDAAELVDRITWPTTEA